MAHPVITIKSHRPDGIVQENELNRIVGFNPIDSNKIEINIKCDDGYIYKMWISITDNEKMRLLWTPYDPESSEV